MVTKNAVIAYGSPRLRKSGSYHLGEHFAKGLKKGGFNIDEIIIHEKTIQPCLGCFSCWSTSPGKCVQRDDMDDLLPILDQADLILADPFDVMESVLAFVPFAQEFLHIGPLLEGDLGDFEWAGFDGALGFLLMVVVVACTYLLAGLLFVARAVKAFRRTALDLHR